MQGCILFRILDGYVVTAFLFLFRGFQIGAFMTIYLYTSEVYPTRLRGTVYGVFGLTRSIGQLSSPLSALVSIFIFFPCVMHACTVKFPMCGICGKSYTFPIRGYNRLGIRMP